MRLLAALLAVVLAASLAGCGATAPVADPHSLTGPVTATVPDRAIVPIDSGVPQQLPATVVDAQGTTVTVTDTSRILALDLYGTTSRIVYELGMGSNMVGRDASSTFPEAAQLPLVTPVGHELNAEAILQLAPTLIITDTSLGPWAVIEQMREAGVAVVVVNSHRSMETVGDITRQVAAALGLAEAGEELALRTQSEIDEAVADVAELAPAEDKLRVAFLYLRGQSGIYYLFGDGSGSDSLIEALGAVDVASEVGVTGMKPMTDEALVAAQPDVVLVMTNGLESVGGVDGLLQQVPAVAQTPAGANRRVVDMADASLMSFGSATPEVLRALADAFYGVAA